MCRLAAAHKTIRLMLLGPPPDMVHGALLHRTRTPIFRNPFLIPNASDIVIIAYPTGKCKCFSKKFSAPRHKDGTPDIQLVFHSIHSGMAQNLCVVPPFWQLYRGRKSRCASASGLLFRSSLRIFGITVLPVEHMSAARRPTDTPGG